MNLLRRLVIKTSMENQKSCSVKCTGKIVFGFQDNLLFFRLILITKGSVFKTQMHIVLIALENLPLVCLWQLCSLGFLETQIELFRRMIFWDPNRYSKTWV